MTKQAVIRFLFLIFFSVIGSIFLFPSDSKAEYNPFDVSSTVKNNWDKTLGGKTFKETTGKNLVYDVYENKVINNGYKIQNYNFDGTGNQPYFAFSGWSVLFGHKRHTSTNNETYIVARKVAGNSGIGTTKVYKTRPRNLSATEDLEYNNQGAGVWNECPASTTNVPNDTCNMRYDNVGFDAFLPFNELFPKEDEKASWRLFIVKKVDSHIVYEPLVLPWDQESLNFNSGKVSLSSGTNTKQLRMNNDNVLRRAYARQPAAEVQQQLGSNRYFTRLNNYTNVQTEESQTAVWYGVRSPHDNNTTKWAATSYWVFSGDQALLSFTPENTPPTHISHSITDHRYKNGEDYWVQPNDEVKVTLRQYDKESGNKYQYIRFNGGNEQVRRVHDFFGSDTNFRAVSPTVNFDSKHLSILSAKRTENTNYGRVEWGVKPHTHGYNWDVLYHYTDNANNSYGYDTGAGKTGMKLRVDGLAPSNIATTITGQKYKNGNDYWIGVNDELNVRFSQKDEHSGNKHQYIRLMENGSAVVRSRHVFAQGAADISEQITNSNISIYKASRKENTQIGTVDWTVLGKTHGKSYGVEYFYRDNVDNGTEYISTNQNIRIDGQAPTHVEDSFSGFKYYDGAKYWVRPNDVVKITFEQQDNHSGNKYQYLRLMEGSSIAVRSRHEYANAASANSQQITNDHISIDKANRTKNTANGRVEWDVKLKTHGKSYSTEYYYQDNVDNTRGYNNADINIGVDGVAPTVAFRNDADTANFNNRDWDSSNIVVRLKHSDPHSGYKRSRYAWSQSTSTPSEGQWSSWTTSANYTTTQQSKGEWYLHVQSEDNVGNVITTKQGVYKLNNPPVADFTFSPSTIYNNTKVSFTNKSTDLDSDTLTNKWEYQAPGTTTWTQFSTGKDPAHTFSQKGTWKIRLTVSDGIASHSVIKNLTVQNRPPVADFTFSPDTIYNDTKVTFTNKSSDPDNDVLTYQWSYKEPDTNTWINFSKEKNPETILSMVGIWEVRLVVTDTSDVTDTIIKKPEVLNRKPIVEVTYEPKPPNPGEDIYEGDTVNVCVKVEDPDKHKMTIKIFIKKDGNKEVLIFTKKEVTTGSSECTEFITESGRYDIIVRVDDGYDETEVDTWFNSKKLLLHGYVNHTPDWEKKHIELGNSLDKFFSGEKFLLEADISPYPVNYVQTTLIANRANGQPVSIMVPLSMVSKILYNGDLYDQSFLEYPTNLKEEPAEFRFKVQYRNGIIKEHVVPIQIIGNTFKDGYKLHRKY